MQSIKTMEHVDQQAWNLYLAFAAASERISWDSELLSWFDNRAGIGQPAYT